MRTTVTLDADVAEKLNAYAHGKRISFKLALNELIRSGLGTRHRPVRRRRFRVKPHHGGFHPGIDPSRLNQLADELEVQDFLAESRATAREARRA